MPFEDLPHEISSDVMEIPNNYVLPSKSLFHKNAGPILNLLSELKMKSSSFSSTSDQYSEESMKESINLASEELEFRRKIHRIDHDEEDNPILDQCELLLLRV